MPADEDANLNDARDRDRQACAEARPTPQPAEAAEGMTRCEQGSGDRDEKHVLHHVRGEVAVCRRVDERRRRKGNREERRACSATMRSTLTHGDR